MKKSYLLAGLLLLTSCSGTQKRMTAKDIATPEVEKTLRTVEQQMKDYAKLAQAKPSEAAPSQEKSYGGDVVAGQKLYVKTCTPCHGMSGKGDGPAAASLPVRPTDHTNGAYMNALTNEHIFKTIKEGGKAVGKSDLMPAFGTSFSDAQIKDLVAYVRTLAKPPYTGK